MGVKREKLIAVKLTRSEWVTVLQAMSAGADRDYWSADESEAVRALTRADFARALGKLTDLIAQGEMKR